MMLYDTIEQLDTAIVKLNYTLQAHRAYTSELLSEYWNDKRIVLRVTDGLNATNNDLIEEFESISRSLTEIMKSQRDDTT